MGGKATASPRLLLGFSTESSCLGDAARTLQWRAVMVHGQLQGAAM